MVDRYAGDEAWGQWFERCQVPRCDKQWREPLWVEIESALKHAIAKKQIRNGALSAEYIRNYFDVYFMLRGNQSEAKPRKKQIMSRIQDARDGLRGVVLGTLMSGEVQTMAREIKEILDEGESIWTVNPKTGEKELRIRSYSTSLRQDDGSEVDQDEVTNVSEIADPSCAWTSVNALDLTYHDSDRKYYQECALKFFQKMAGENIREKNIAVAAMIYVKAYKISTAKPIIGKLLGNVSPVTVFNRINEMTEKLNRFCNISGIRVCDLMFAEILLKISCEVLERGKLLTVLQDEVREKKTRSTK